MRRISAPAAAIAASTVLLGLAPAARGATVAVGAEELELGGPPVVFTAAPGEANDLTVSSIDGDPDAVVFRDTGPRSPRARAAPASRTDR